MSKNAVSSAGTCVAGKLRQFEVYESPSALDRDIAPYIVVLQSHFLDALPTVVVAPLLRPEAAERLAYLSVEVVIGDERFVLSLHELATVPKRSLRHKLGDVRNQEDAISRGLQRLFTGF